MYLMQNDIMWYSKYEMISLSCRLEGCVEYQFVTHEADDLDI